MTLPICAREKSRGRGVSIMLKIASRPLPSSRGVPTGTARDADGCCAPGMGDLAAPDGQSRRARVGHPNLLAIRSFWCGRSPAPGRHLLAVHQVGGARPTPSNPSRTLAQLVIAHLGHAAVIDLGVLRAGDERRHSTHRVRRAVTGLAGGSVYALNERHRRQHWALAIGIAKAGRNQENRTTGRAAS